MMKKKKLFVVIIILFLLPFIHSQTVQVTPANVCYPSSNVSIITEGFNGAVDVFYTFYNSSNKSIIYTQGSYSYSNLPEYIYNLTLNNLPPGVNQSIEYNITVENCTNNLCTSTIFNGYINSSYPFYFEYQYNPIYTGSDDNVSIIPGCQESQNVINSTYFNFTVTLPNGTTILTRVNCLETNNTCDLNISNYDNVQGNYTFNGTYYYNGLFFNISFVDNPLQVLTPPQISIPNSVNVTPNSVCYPSDFVNITTINITGEVKVYYIFYNPNNLSDIYAQGEYEYSGYIHNVYTYTTQLNNLPPGVNQSIEYNITVENCTYSFPFLYTCTEEIINGYINSSYPFYFEYYDNPIYVGSDDAAYIIPGCQESQNVINSTYFNFTVTLPNGTTILTRVNCSGAGDPDWGPNICDLYISNYDNVQGNYTFNGTYYYNGLFFNISFVDNPLQVLTASSGTFTNQQCSHGGTDTSASTTSNPLSLNINYYGLNSGTYYTYYNGIYVLAQNTTLGFNVSGGYNVLCSDGATGSGYPAITIWLYGTNQYYNLNSEQYMEGISNLGINFTSYSVDRQMIYNVYPDEGFVYSGLDWTSPVEGSPSIYVYNFTENDSGYYVVYQDYIKTICNSPMSFICDPDGTLCNIGHIQGEAQGWLPINPEPGYYILVINPNASVNLQNVTYYPYVYNTNPGDAIYIGWIDNVGIGNLTVNENWTLPDILYENNNFLLPEGQNVSLYVYFPTNECLHVNCQIPYNISYQNAYGLTVYSPISYSGYVNINWDSLNIYTNPSLTKVTYGEPTNITIAVENLGPVPAENVSAYNIEYDPSCIEVLNVYPISSISPDSIGYLNIEINITNLNCKPQDYNISFQVYGWNTYIYNYSLILLISYIISPPNGAQLQSSTVFNIYDINAQTCYISFNGALFNRNCNSSFLYQSYMCPGSECNVQIQSLNNYSEFYQNYEYYNYLTNRTTIFGIVLPSTVIGIYVGQYYTYSALVKSLVPSVMSCQLIPIPTTQNGKAVVVGYDVNGENTLQFNIPPEGIARLDIDIVGEASGIDNLIFGLSCNSSYGSSSYTQEVPIYIFTSNNVISNYTIQNIIVSEKLNPIYLIGVSSIAIAIISLLL